jgi:hypothetical protein
VGMVQRICRARAERCNQRPGQTVLGPGVVREVLAVNRLERGPRYAGFDCAIGRYRGALGHEARQTRVPKPLGNGDLGCKPLRADAPGLGRRLTEFQENRVAVRPRR